MKYQILIFFGLCLILFSCGPSAEEMAMRAECRQKEKDVEMSVRENVKNTFDSPFPGRNRNLAKILGDTIQIEGRCYPFSLKIVSNRKSNIVINIEEGDTIFNGTVCKYKELYYFNEKLNDTTFRIFALKITENQIYGLQNYFQYLQTDTAIEHGSYPMLVKYVDKNKKAIRLHPDKRELKRLFSSIITRTDPFEIIKPIAISTTIEPEDPDSIFETNKIRIISTVYPNPVVDIFNVELLQENENSTYFLSDLNGKIIMQGQFQGITNKINISNISDGTYSLTIVTQKQQRETVKIIKTK